MQREHIYNADGTVRMVKPREEQLKDFELFREAGLIKEDCDLCSGKGFIGFCEESNALLVCACVQAKATIAAAENNIDLHKIEVVDGMDFIQENDIKANQYKANELNSHIFSNK